MGSLYRYHVFIRELKELFLSVELYCLARLSLDSTLSLKDFSFFKILFLAQNTDNPYRITLNAIKNVIWFYSLTSCCNFPNTVFCPMQPLLHLLSTNLFLSQTALLPLIQPKALSLPSACPIHPPLQWHKRLCHSG